MRQTLDDDVPETPLQQRDLLTKVVVSAARADRELDAQSQAFEQLRDLVINAPTRLDAMTQQMVGLTARIEPSGQTLANLHTQFDSTALSSVSTNVDLAKERLAFADRNISTARNLVSRPADDQTALVDAVRSAESALDQTRTLLDAVDSAASDINRALADLPAAITDIQAGIDQANALLGQSGTPQADKLSTVRDAAKKAADDATANGKADPLGTFTRLTKADAELDQLLPACTNNRRQPNGWPVHWSRRCSPPSHGSRRCRTSSRPGAAALARRHAPGWPRPNGSFRPPRPSARRIPTRR